MSILICSKMLAECQEIRNETGGTVRLATLLEKIGKHEEAEDIRQRVSRAEAEE